MPLPPARSVSGTAHRSGAAMPLRRALPEEVPVAMVYDGSTQAVMMATPGDIPDFAVGFALSEGIVTDLSQIRDFEQVSHETGIEARLWLAADRGAQLAARRRFMAGPVGCGLCGIDSLDQALRPLPRIDRAGPRFTHATVARAGDALRAGQMLYDQTRATHAAGFLRPDGEMLLLREDVGRHNALDKLIGAMARQGLDPGTGAFVLSSRLSVELVQKSAVAGCPMLIAVSAPTAHAQRLAEGAGITLVAFARGEGFDIYSHAHRITSEIPDVA